MIIKTREEVLLKLKEILNAPSNSNAVAVVHVTVFGFFTGHFRTEISNLNWQDTGLSFFDSPNNVSIDFSEYGNYYFYTNGYNEHRFKYSKRNGHWDEVTIEFLLPVKKPVI